MLATDVIGTVETDVKHRTQAVPIMSMAEADSFTEEDRARHGWQIVSLDDWVLRQNLRDEIVGQVNKVIEVICEANMIDANESNPERNPFDLRRSSVDIINGYLFPVKTWRHMIEDDSLPKNCKHGRIIYELDLNRLRIREIASAAHDAAANSLNTAIAIWSTNSATMPESLVQMGQAQWYFQPGSEMSPDQAFRPLNIQVRINQAKLVPGSNSIIYPTLTIEVSNCYESYSQLLADAETKHFSQQTSVQAWLGIKLFTQTSRMRVAFKLRDNLVGHGSDPARQIESETISLLQPTNIEIIIPKSRIYFGLPPAQIPPTPLNIPSPNALPRVAVPYGPIDDFIVSLDLIRRRVLENWN